MMTYWLYHNGQPFDAVRLPPNSPDYEVKQKALNNHDRVPCCHTDFPDVTSYEHRVRIHHSVIYSEKSQ